METKDIESSSRSLWFAMRSNSWFQAVGIGNHQDKPILMLYSSKRLNKSTLETLPKEWEGFTVKSAYIGKLTPL